MAGTSNRCEVIAALVKLLPPLYQPIAGDNPITVTDGPPPEIDRECVTIGDLVTTSLGLNTFGTATRRDRLDVFTVHVHIWAGAPGQTAPEARARAQELYAVIDNLCATNTQLGGVDGLLAAVITGQDGPNVEPSDTEGYVGLSTAYIGCQSHLT